MRGTVKWWHEEKGYGFIRPEDSDGSRDQDLFLHFSEVERRVDEDWVQLHEGEPVEYEVGLDKRGRRCAVTVRRLMRPTGAI